MAENNSSRLIHEDPDFEQVSKVISLLSLPYK